jgi:calcium/calmodulin-dependent protein kinase I
MKSSESKVYKGIHNLSHYFLELSQEYIENNKSNKNSNSNSNSYEEDESYIDSASSISLENKSKSNSDKEKTEEFKPIIKVINSKEYFCFILINQKGKAQWYLTPDKDLYIEWVQKLKLVMNYQNIFDKYILKEIVGKGKFSTVYRAIDKIKNQTVAIKIIDKRILKLNELDLIKTEIDILKICQHPYVVTLYEVIETYAHIDIVLEYCKISNLYQYLHNKNFNLTELQIVTYIHKISKAVYSMHNLGIIHRDLKLSNIALASEKEDIRILDFGLSKIIGPGETCSESYGTPGYAAPEVINEDNYGFKIDVWSIGAITYFMCTSKLPFDYVTKGLKVKNIVINTLNDEIKFKDDCWKKFSKEAIQFIKGCMNKKPEKRLTIKEVLEHEWIKKFFFKEVTRRESVDMREYITEFNHKNDHKNKKKIFKSPQKNNCSTGIYRLYADISPDEGKK